MKQIQMRLKRLRELMREEKVSGCLVMEPVNLLYLTGQPLSAGVLFVGQRSARLFVDGRYFEAVQGKAPVPVAELTEKNLTSFFGKQEGVIGFEADRLSYNGYLRWKKRCKRMKALEQPIERLRAVKDAEELELLRSAAVLGSKGWDAAVAALKEGIGERELATFAERVWLDAGAEDTSFSTIVAFGPNSAAPHHRAGHRKLRRGDTVLIDLGVKLNGYCSDMTRVVFYGRPPAQMKKIYQLVRDAHQKAMEQVRPGVMASQVDSAARDLIEEQGYGPQFCHGLGHGVGMEIHELPVVNKRSKTILEPGQVITIEPGIYLPGVGGVRIENTVVVTEDGFEDFSCRDTQYLQID